jgi:two-component system, OmpR family, response regulator
MKSNTLTTKQTKQILIIEDNGDMCLLLNIMLKDNDVELEHVKTLGEAKTFLEANKPSLILLDNKLPDGLGIDFINYIKTNYPSVKIMMISGFAQAAKDIALNNGADLFIEKPFTRDQVFSSVQALLN